VGIRGPCRKRRRVELVSWPIRSCTPISNLQPNDWVVTGTLLDLDGSPLDLTDAALEQAQLCHPTVKFPRIIYDGGGALECQDFFIFTGHIRRPSLAR
jgi:hypothetical protein